MNVVDATRYSLIGQGYSAFGDNHPAGNAMQNVSDSNRTIFWCIDSKKYLIFDHVKEVAGLKVRLTSVKNFNKIL